jgi:hypothetical protein
MYYIYTFRENWGKRKSIVTRLFQCRAQALWGWQGQFNFAMHSTALIYELMHFLSQERGLLLLDGMRLQSLEDPLGVDAPCDVS